MGEKKESYKFDRFDWFVWTIFFAAKIIMWSSFFIVVFFDLPTRTSDLAFVVSMTSVTILLLSLVFALTYYFWKEKIKKTVPKEDLYSTPMIAFVLTVLYIGVIVLGYFAFKYYQWYVEPDDDYYYDDGFDIRIEIEINETTDFWNITITDIKNGQFNDSTINFYYYLEMYNYSSEYPLYEETQTFSKLGENGSEYIIFFDTDDNLRVTENDRISISKNISESYNGVNVSFAYIEISYFNKYDDNNDLLLWFYWEQDYFIIDE